MRRSIAAIAVTISTRFVKNVAEGIVAVLAYPLRALDHARLLLMRLPGPMPAGLQTARSRLQGTGIPAAPALEPSCSRTRWHRQGNRPAEPGSRLDGIGF